MKRRPVVAIVGTGFMAQTHLAAYSRLQSADIRYVVGRRLDAAEALAEGVGAEGVVDLDVVLADSDVDLIDITVPTPLHRDMAVAAFRAGKHVIVEKPIASDPSQADEMIAAARLSGRRLFVAHVLRFWPAYVRVAEAVKSNRLGRPLYARAYRLASPPRWAAWLSDRKQTGGAAVDLGIHDVDFLNSIFGAPRSVQAWGTHCEDGIALQYAASIEYQGLVAITEASMAMPDHYAFTSGIQIQFERGLVEHHFKAGGSSFEEGEAVDTTVITESGRPPEVLVVETNDPFEAQLSHFIEALTDEEEDLVVTAEDARLALAVAGSINESIRQGRRIAI